MAAGFAAGSTQYLTTSSTPVASVPLTLAGWFNSSTASGAIVSIGVSSGSGIQRFQLVLSSQRVQAAVVSNTGYAANTTTTYTLNKWAHGCGVFSSNASRTAYLDGGGASTETTSATPSGLTSVAIGARYQSGFGLLFSGSLAEIGIWSAALTQDEIVSLSRGVSPYKIRPQSLVFYTPLIRDVIDLRGGLGITNTNGVTVADHPRVYI